MIASHGSDGDHPFGTAGKTPAGKRLESGKHTRIRLFGVDAPELSQKGGERAKSYMISLVGGKQVPVDPVTSDCHGRIVAASGRAIRDAASPTLRSAA